MRALTTAVALLLSAAAFAGVDADLLGKIAKRQAALDEYAVQMRISVFPATDSQAADAAAEIEFPAWSVRKGPATLQEFRNFIVLLHPDMRLVVDRADRTIHLNAGRAEAATPAGFEPAAILEQAAKGGYAIASEEGAGHVTLRFTSDARPAYLLRFTSPDLMLARMEMDAPPEAGGGRTVITYDWQSTGVDPNRLTKEFYVRRERGTWQPSPAFAGFRVVVARDE